MLSVPPEQRTEQDIHILERCTSFLAFFQNIKIDDPQNIYDAHRGSCRVLTRSTCSKGKFVCKHSNIR